MIDGITGDVASRVVIAAGELKKIETYFISANNAIQDSEAGQQYKAESTRILDNLQDLIAHSQEFANNIIA